MIDVVYPLGRGSHWDDGELRYSLRSLARYVHGIRNVYVIGERPRWLTNVYHISHSDPHACKERNIADKVLRACTEPGLSEQFLFINDDHFCLGDCVAADIPYWRGGQLADLARKLSPASHYREAMNNTIKVLEGVGRSTWNFDIHLPMVMDKEFYTLAMACYDWEVTRGYVLKSLYANSVGYPGTATTDLKIIDRHPMSQLVRLLSTRSWWSIGPSALGTNMKELLAALYPEPSPWEKI